MLQQRTIVYAINRFVAECRQYIKLNFSKVDHTVPAVVGGTETVPQEFPHMVLLIL